MRSHHTIGTGKVNPPAASTVEALLRAGLRLLEGSSLSPRLDTELLLARALGWDRARLFMNRDQPVAAAVAAQFIRDISARRTGRPLAHITGRREFWSLDLAVTTDVLVPRPETELLVERALLRLPADRPARVLDLGTGSGVLAIAARKLAPVRVLATDIDPVATHVARENVRLNGIASGVALETAPGFHSTAFRRHGPFDLIIANILARPLMRMAPQLAAQLAPGGAVVLSGILAEQRWKVLAAYNGAGLRHVRTLWRNGWVTIHLDRR